MAARRRAAGEGSLFQLPDGRWRGQLKFTASDGLARRLVTTRKTRREVVQWLQEAKEKASDVAAPTTTTKTLEQWFTIYLRDVARARVRPSTFRSYEQHFEQHIRPVLGRTRLDRLTPAQIALFYDTRLALGLSPSTVHLIHATLRRALTIAVRWGEVSRNVTQLVDPPRRPVSSVQPLTLEEAKAFLDVAAEHRLCARWTVALTLGLRQGEALGLWWSDIDFERAELRVSRQLVARSGVAPHFAPLKTSRSQRTLVVPPTLLHQLQKHRAGQDVEKAQVTSWSDARLVFPTRRGTPISQRNDLRAFKALLRSAGLRDIRLHDLRHTAASLLLAEGVHPRMVMETLGHSQIGLTMNTYSHVMPSLLHRVADSMEASLWGSGSE